jgi:rod shape-determining protein MreC
MNKKFLPYLFIIAALFTGAFYYSNAIQSPLLSFLNGIKSSYHSTTDAISKTIDKHFFQAQEIQRLSDELQKYEKNHLIMQAMDNELKNLYKENNSSLKFNPKVELVRTIAYEKFGNFNRIWLEIPDYNASKIYGLVYKELVAGIVVSKENKALALLNSDIKSTYAVFIGDKKAPGIAHGNNDEHIIVNFIPAWSSIAVGDEVTTSGLDNIFFANLKVGKIISISRSQGYQNAVIEPYFKPNEPNYFHIIRSLH